MLKEANRFNKEFIETGRALGELEHPDYTYINSERAHKELYHLVKVIIKLGLVNQLF